MEKTVKQENIIYFCNAVSHLTNRSHTDNNAHNYFYYNATSDLAKFFFLILLIMFYFFFYFISCYKVKGKNKVKYLFIMHYIQVFKIFSGRM